MATYADKMTDKRLAEMEAHIKKMYQKASDDLQATANAYFSSFAERYEKEYDAYLQGKYTDAQFKAWYYAQVGRGERWQQLKTNMAQEMTRANQRAVAYINDNTPGIYSLNANYSAYEIEGATGISFDLVNEQAVKNLMKGKNHTEFRTLSVNPKRDYAWNSQKIQESLLSGILQGDSIKRLTDRYMDVMGANRNAAIRNARTAVTSAQNGGRQSTFDRAKAMGIELQKEWMATNDARTRDSHRELDGVRVENEDLFPNGCRYPGDPGGEPGEVYNCRCTMRGILPKYNGKARTSNTVESYKKWEDDKKKTQNILLAPQTNGTNSVTINQTTAFNNLAMDQAHIDRVSDILNSCGDADLQHAYEASKNGLKLDNGNVKSGAYYDPATKGVSINLKKVSQATTTSNEYETFFHEFGHNMDYYAHPDGISYVYRDANGNSLYDALQNDYNALVNRATGGVKLKKADSAKKAIDMIQNEISVKALPCTSDMLESFTGVKFPLTYDEKDARGITVRYGCGHGSSYWKQGKGVASQTSAEFFAEVCESIAANPESLAALNKYFPSGVKMVKEILGGM